MSLYFSNTHIVHVHGYTIIYEANMYHLALYPDKKYIVLRDAIKEIDRIEEERIALENKIVNGKETGDCL